MKHPFLYSSFKILTAAFFFAAISARATDDPQLASRVLTTFQQACYRCHGDPGQKVRGGFGYVTDFDKLRASAYLDLKNPDKSKLYTLIQSGDMPFEGDPLTGPQTQDVLNWIRAGAPSPGGPNSEKPGPLTTPEGVFNELESFLQKQPVQSRSDIRFVSLIADQNLAAAADKIEASRLGLRKLLNSVSWQPTLAELEAIRPGLAIYAFRLSALGWTADFWESLASGSPFRFMPDIRVSHQARADTQSRMPILPGEWLARVLSRPPFYHQALGLSDRLEGFEQMLGVDSAQDVANGKVLRAGFGGEGQVGGSGVSKNNRMIERHQSKYGYYWKSFDFAQNVGVQDLFRLPLGPSPREAKSFRHAGGEMIFALPNGLQGYLVTNSAGTRLDAAPINIVQDTSRSDAQIVNGISCMSCHVSGIQEKADRVASFAKDNAGLFDAGELERIQALYGNANGLSAAFQADGTRFRSALKELGVEPKASTEPIRLLVEKSEEFVDLAKAAALLGLAPADLVAKAQAVSAARATVSQLQTGIAAENFEELVPELETDLGLGVDAYSSPLALTGAEFPFSTQEFLKACDVDSFEREVGEQKTLEFRDARGQSWLHLAAAEDCDSITRFLIDATSAGLFNARDVFRRTPSQVSIAENRLGSLAVFAESPLFAPGLIDGDGYPMLQQSVRNAFVEGVRLLLRDTRVDLATQDVYGRTALDYAQVLYNERPRDPNVRLILEAIENSGKITVTDF